MMVRVSVGDHEKTRLVTSWSTRARFSSRSRPITRRRGGESRLRGRPGCAEAGRGGARDGDAGTCSPPGGGKRCAAPDRRPHCASPRCRGRSNSPSTRAPGPSWSAHAVGRRGGRRGRLQSPPRACRLGQPHPRRTAQSLASRDCGCRVPLQATGNIRRERPLLARHDRRPWMRHLRNTCAVAATVRRRVRRRNSAVTISVSRSRASRFAPSPRTQLMLFPARTANTPSNARGCRPEAHRRSRWWDRR